MHNWHEVVSGKLKRFDLPEDVVAEIASHVEEQFESSRKRGAPEDQAITACVEELEQVAKVGGRILRSRGRPLMNSRVKRLWIPGFVAFAAADGLFELLHGLHGHTSIVATHGAFEAARYVHQHGVFAIYIPWLVGLPFCGAAGAYLSRRSGGRVAAPLSSGLAPAVASLGFCLFAFTGFGVEHILALFQHPVGFLRYARDWALFPAMALLLGVLPICALAKRDTDGPSLA